MKALRISREVWAMAVVLVVGLVVIADLVYGIWQLQARLERIQAADEALQPLLARAEDQHDSLVNRREDSSLTETAEKWARVHLGWARPGEVVLSVPLAPPAAAPSPVTPPPTPTPAPSLWQRLQAWLSGES